jgi:hypothetical protein
MAGVSMWSMIRRAVIPFLLLIVGAASFLYGSFFRIVPVLEEKETPTTIEVPAEVPPDATMNEPAPTDESGTMREPSSMGEPGPMGGPSDFPGGNFSGPPPMVKKEVIRVDRNILAVPENGVVRDVTVGGLTLLSSGTIKRTYDSSSGKGPALCPS